MSTRQKAAQVIRDHGAGTICNEPECIAQDLADAGLLAPDLPEPRIDIDEWQEWGHKHGPNVALENGKITVCIPDDISRDLTPGEARELAAWLNAAANYAEVDAPMNVIDEADY